MANINLGKVALTPAGEYDSTTTYDKLDVVNYQGSSYVAKKSMVAGVTTGNDEYWQLLAEKGDKGETGYATEWGNIGGSLNDQTDLNNILNSKSPTIEKKLSGSIVHFEDGSTLPVSDLKVNIESVQDLNDYDNLWPGGGNVNLLSAPESYDTTTSGIRVKYDGNGKYTLSGTNTSSATIGFEIEIPSVTLPSSDIYMHLRNDISTSDISLWFMNGSTQITGVTFSTLNRISKIANLSGATITKLKLTFPANYAISGSITFQLSFELGSAVTTWTPYANVCPISGHSSTVVTRTGKNFLGNINNSGTLFNVTFTVNDGVITADGTSNRGDETNYTVKNPLYLPAGTYSLNGIGANGSSTTPKKSLRATVFDKNNSVRSRNNDYGSGVTFTVYDGDYVRVQIFFDDGALFSPSSPIYPMIRAASDSDSTYEPYQGTSVTIDLGEERYGGTLDVLTGILTVTDANIPSYAGETLPSTWISSMDAYEEGATPTTGAQVVYKLASPQTIPLSPATLSLLKGENNLWSDTGDVAVEYRADTKMYIDNAIAEANRATKTIITAVTDTMVAPKNLVTNDLIIVGDDLYKITANVNNGSSLVVNSNCTKITLAQYILSVLS